jgi:putative ABC transport system ATP-binding protein
MNDIIFELKNVKKSFRINNPSASGTENNSGLTQVLEIGHLSIPAGQLIAIVGGSGVGKTTFLNLLGGLDRPDSPTHCDPAPQINLSPPASVRQYLAGQVDLVTASREERAVVSRHISYVFQSSYLLEAASVKLNLEIIREAAGTAAGPAALKEALQLAQFSSEEIDQKLAQRVLTLSGGEKKRVGLARAFVRDPFVILADEPTSDLDPKRAQEAIAALKRWVRDGKGARSVLWVTHDYDLAQAADAVLPIRNGHPLEVIPIDALPAGMSRKEAIEQLVYGRLGIDDITKHRNVHQPNGGVDEVATHEVGGHPTNAPDRSIRLRAEIWNGARLAGYEMFAPSTEQDRRLWWSPLRLIERYTQSASAVVILMLALLSLLSLAVALQVRSYFATEIGDPRLRHVVVEGDIKQSEFPILNAGLSKLDADIRKVVDGGLEGRFAFGRLTGSKVIISYADNDGKAVGRAIDAEILRVDPDEPITEVLPVKTGAGTTTIRQLLEQVKYPGVIVSGRFLTRLAQAQRGADAQDQPKLPLIKDQPKSLIMRHHGTEVAFSVAGIAENLPTDGQAVFDGIVSHEHHRAWMLEVKPDEVEPDPEVAHRYRIPSFERVAVYFDGSNYDKVIGTLDAKLYLFDRANLYKLRRLISVANGLNNFLLLLLIVVAIVVWFVNAMLVRIYLQSNEKQIAVLMAHGAANTLAVVSVLVQVLASWLLSHCAIFLVVSLIVLVMMAVRSLTSAPDGWAEQFLQLIFSDNFILSAWLAPLLTLGVLVLATAVFYARWKCRLPPLAQVLRQP